MTDQAAFEHGASAYVHHGCRCDICTRGNYQRCLRNKQRRYDQRVEVDGRLVAPNAPSHGSATIYSNWGCRCDPCYQAQSVKNRADKQRRRAAVSS